MLFRMFKFFCCLLVLLFCLVPVARCGGNNGKRLLLSEHSRSDAQGTIALKSSTGSMAQAQGQSDQTLIVYDFDQTISQKHVFTILRRAAHDKGHSSQLAFRQKEVNKIVRKEHAFGTRERISALQQHFAQLKDKQHARLVILSFGYKQNIQIALQSADLQKYFRETDIIGCEELEAFKSSFECGLSQPGLKADYIAKTFARKTDDDRPLFQKITFVEDDEKNIAQVEQRPICVQTVHIADRKGMDAQCMRVIEDIQQHRDAEEQTQQRITCYLPLSEDEI